MIRRYADVTPYTFFCVLAFLQGAILFGLDTALFGSIQALPSFLKDFGDVNAAGKYALPPLRSSLMNSLPWIGKFSGCFFSEMILERIGFKKTALLANMLQFTGVILEIAAPHWAMFTVGRIVTYLAVGLCENMVPGYASEIAPAHHRGLLAGSLNTFSGAGNLWGAGMGQAFKSYTARSGWQIPIGMQFIPAALMVILVQFTPESPRWLLLKGRNEEAERNLKRLRRKIDVDMGITNQEFDLISRLVQEGRERDGGQWRDLMKGNFPYRLWVVCTVFIIAQTNGSQFVQSFGPTFYKQQGLGESAFLYNLLGFGLAFVAGFVGVLLFDIVGRRPCFIYAGALVAFLLYLAAGLGLRSHTTPTTHTIVACLIMLKSFTRISASNVSYLTGAEVGGVRMRKKIMAVGTSTDVLGAFIVTFTTPYLMPVIGINIAWIFGSVALFGVIWGILFFPELKGRSLEEVDEIFETRLWGWQVKGYQTHGIAAQLHAVEHHQVATGKEEIEKNGQVEMLERVSR